MVDVTDFLRQIQETAAGRLPPNGPVDNRQPGGDDNGRMEHRVTALETRLDTVLPTLATKADLAELKTEVHKGFAEMVKWIVGTGFVGLAALITIMAFVLNNATPKAAPPVQQAPIIINVPAASPAPAAK